MKQSFHANRVVSSVENYGPLVAFGEEDDDQSVIHFLQFMRDDDHSGPKAVYLEFNDQINACDGESLGDIRLEDDRLTVVFRDGSAVRSGFVEGRRGEPLRELAVRFQIPIEELRSLRQRLETILSGGCVFSYVGAALAK